MATFRIICAIILAVTFSMVGIAQTLDEVVQHHESTLAGLNSYRVDVLTKPSDRPWGTEYDIRWLDERNGNAHKITTIQPGIMTDALGNNPVPGVLGSMLSDDSGTRDLSYPQEYAADFDQAFRSGKRVMPGDRAYIGQSMSHKKTFINTAMMHPRENASLSEMIAKAKSSSLQISDDQCIIQCNYFDFDYIITIDPQRNYMITNIKTSHKKGGYQYESWVKQWAQIEGFWLPTEIEEKSTSKVGNRIYQYSNWQIGDRASSLLEVKYLPGSVVRSATHAHIWGENDQPEVSFPINDQAALNAYEQEVLRKARARFIDSKPVRVSCIIGLAATLLSIGYWMTRYSPLQSRLRGS